jgi:hypothetical protein
MTYLIIKAAVSGIIVMIVSEVGLRNPGISGLIASVPLISILAFIWLWRDTSDPERIAAQAEATFWYIFPSIPMFSCLASDAQKRRRILGGPFYLMRAYARFLFRDDVGPVTIRDQRVGDSTTKLLTRHEARRI